MHDVEVESVFRTKAIRRSGLGPRLEPRNPGVVALPGRRTRSPGGRWAFTRSMLSSRVTSTRPSGSSARRDVGGRADRGGGFHSSRRCSGSTRIP